MANRGLAFRCENQRRTLAEAGKHGAGLFQRIGDVLIAIQLVDFQPFLGRNLAKFQQAINEHPEARMGRDAPGGSMRAFEKAELLQILHHIANGSGGKRRFQPA